MATNNQVNVGLSGESGGSSGSLVGTTSPTLVTPDLGVAAATSLDFGASSTTGLVATATNDNAGTGYVGEYVSSSVVEGSAAGLTTGVAQNVTSISLGAGDWEVCGSVFFKAAATTTSSSQQMGINSVSATIPSDNNSFCSFRQPITGSQTVSLNNAGCRFSLSGTTTIYLVAYADFAVSTMSVYGFIGARRVR